MTTGCSSIWMRERNDSAICTPLCVKFAPNSGSMEHHAALVGTNLPQNETHIWRKAFFNLTLTQQFKKIGFLFLVCQIQFFIGFRQIMRVIRKYILL